MILSKDTAKIPKKDKIHPTRGEKKGREHREKHPYSPPLSLFLTPEGRIATSG